MPCARATCSPAMPPHPGCSAFRPAQRQNASKRNVDGKRTLSPHLSRSNVPPERRARATGRLLICRSSAPRAPHSRAARTPRSRAALACRSSRLTPRSRAPREARGRRLSTCRSEPDRNDDQNGAAAAARERCSPGIQRAHIAGRLAAAQPGSSGDAFQEHPLRRTLEARKSNALYIPDLEFPTPPPTCGSRRCAHNERTTHGHVHLGATHLLTLLLLRTARTLTKSSPPLRRRPAACGILAIRGPAPTQPDSLAPPAALWDDRQAHHTVHRPLRIAGCRASSVLNQGMPSFVHPIIRGRRMTIRCHTRHPGRGTNGWLRMEGLCHRAPCGQGAERCRARFGN